mmetsp:Transcript_15349/g.27373  ORF Transcript_15349/g.27373 Transcript_15349/m.27373 type:complete len:291 (-) Transcript_15349:101-973(-)
MGVACRGPCARRARAVSSLGGCGCCAHRCQGRTFRDCSLFGSTKECQICLEAWTDRHFLVPCKDQCQHALDICQTCIKRHIGAELDKGRVATIRCPHGSCHAILSYADIYRISPKELFPRYQKLLRDSYLQKDPNFRWCAHSGCGNGQIVDNVGKGVFMTCQKCQRRTCTHHMCVWHDDCTCDQYDKEESERLRCEEIATLGLLRRTVRCPSCKHGVQKSEGCDLMTCRCGTRFCYICRANYDGPRGIIAIGNHAHRRECKHYRPNVQVQCVGFVMDVCIMSRFFKMFTT